MDVVVAIGLVIAYAVLQIWILPRMGVPT